MGKRIQDANVWLQRQTNLQDEERREVWAIQMQRRDVGLVHGPEKATLLRRKNLLGRTLLQLRTTAGLSQHELACMADVAHDVVRRIERGVTSPTVWTLAQIAQALEAQIVIAPYPVAIGGGRSPREDRT